MKKRINECGFLQSPSAKGFRSHAPACMWKRAVYCRDLVSTQERPCRNQKNEQYVIASDRLVRHSSKSDGGRERGNLPRHVSLPTPAAIRWAIMVTLITLVLSGIFLTAASALADGQTAGSTICPTPGQALGQTTGHQFLAAVTDYENGSFDQAAQTFEAIADSGIRNGDLYYDLGNAWFRAGDIGRAVLWYERARKIMPDDPELAFNLNYVRGFVKDQQPEAFSVLKAIFFWRYLLSQKMTVILASIAAVLFCLTLFLRKILARRPPGWLVSVCLIVWVIFAATAGFNFYAENAFTQGVILPDQVSVKSGLSDLATELFVLHAGSRVSIEDARKDYYRIRFGSDKIGWLKADMVGVI